MPLTEGYSDGRMNIEIWGYTTDRLYTTEDFDSQGKLKNNIPKVEGYNPNPGDIDDDLAHCGIMA